MELKVLVVEDDADMQELISDICEEEAEELNLSCAIKKAENGEEALKELNTNDFNLVISDLKMPKMDGNEFVRRKSELDNPNREIPVILLSGFINESELDKEKNIYYLAKPIDESRLKRVFKLYVLPSFKKNQTAL